MKEFFVILATFAFVACGGSKTQKDNVSVQDVDSIRTSLVDSVDSTENNTFHVQEDTLKQLNAFASFTETQPESVKELIAGFRFGRSVKQNVDHAYHLPRLECDQFRLDLDCISYCATTGKSLFYEDKLYAFNVYITWRYHGLEDWVDLTKADFDSLATYFKSVYGSDSNKYMYTEADTADILSFSTHHWRKKNLYFRLYWIPENIEGANVIGMEFINGPVYRKALIEQEKRLSPR